METALTGTRQKWRGSLFVFPWWGLVVPREKHGLGVRAFFIVRVSLLQRKYFGVRADLSAMQSYLRGCDEEHHYIVKLPATRRGFPEFNYSFQIHAS